MNDSALSAALTTSHECCSDTARMFPLLAHLKSRPGTNKTDLEKLKQPMLTLPEVSLKLAAQRFACEKIIRSLFLQ